MPDPLLITVGHLQKAFKTLGKKGGNLASAGKLAPVSWRGPRPFFASKGLIRAALTVCQPSLELVRSGCLLTTPPDWRVDIYHLTGR